MLAWLQRVRPDPAVDESPAVLQDARLGLVEPGRRIRPQPLRERRRAREYLWELVMLLCFQWEVACHIKNIPLCSIDIYLPPLPVFYLLYIFSTINVI